MFATNTQLSNNPDKVISTIDYAVTIDECTIDDDNIYIRALSGTDVAERIGNVIYLNGVKEATISDTIDINNSETVMPRTGWVSTDTCPMGTASEYTKLSSTKERNIELEKWSQIAVGDCRYERHIFVASNNSGQTQNECRTGTFSGPTFILC